MSGTLTISLWLIIGGLVLLGALFLAVLAAGVNTILRVLRRYIRQ